MKNKFFYLLSVSLFLVSCASTTEQGTIGVNRKQFLFGVSAEQMNELAARDYNKAKQEASSKKSLDANPAQVQRVQAVANRIISQVGVFRGDATGWAWETHVITSPDINAYCMPGGKIVFYSGIIEKLNMTDGEIAAVMGHEVAHALREHSRERYSQALAQQAVLGVAVASEKISTNTAQYAGILAQLGWNLPNSRGQESEADDIGIELMARAGYDPQEAVTLWQKMSKASGGGKNPLSFLSTHPSDEKRISALQNLVPKVRPLYLNATKK